MEIQKAEDFAIDMDLCFMPEYNLDRAIGLIRFRDKAIIESLRKVILDPKLRHGWDYDGLWKTESGRWIDLNELLESFDSVLREIEGDK